MNMPRQLLEQIRDLCGEHIMNTSAGEPLLGPSAQLAMDVRTLATKAVSALSELDKSPDVGGGKTFTEEQVKKFMNDMFMAHHDPGHFTLRHREEKVIGQPYEETTPQWQARAKRLVGEKHGITL